MPPVSSLRRSLPPPSDVPDLERVRDQPASTAWVRNPGLEEVRRAMLQSLSGVSGCEVARMNMRLRYASDIEALWYLRSDLQRTLAALRGERRAQSLLVQLTALFQGRLPQSLRPTRAPHLPHAHHLAPTPRSH